MTVPSSTRAAAGTGDCRPGHACVWHHANYSGYRLTSTTTAPMNWPSTPCPAAAPGRTRSAPSSTIRPEAPGWSARTGSARAAAVDGSGSSAGRVRVPSPR
ncbi:peptidase inhibitor family I36 protein [Streptomyces sviceus]|uniref:peptidase inhibitor family I36 protein n=1 Tax=Streptomyces sviceus TaxID=285530 RepID=UPI0036BE138A